MYHEGRWQIGVHREEEAAEFISLLQNGISPLSNITGKVSLQAATSKENYLEVAERIKQHIRRGDIFEMNYCMEFFAEGCRISPSWYIPASTVSVGRRSGHSCNWTPTATCFAAAPNAT